MNPIKYRKWWYLLSLVIIIPGTISLLLFGLKASVDFTGGTVIQIQGTTNKTLIESFTKKDHFGNVTITPTKNGLIITSKAVSEANHKEFRSDIGKLKNVKEIQVQTVGPSISKQVTQNAFTSIVLASIVVVVYVAFSFRKIPKPANSWEFGIAAIIALLHDALVLLGIFSILGHFFGIEVDPLFITAVLTVIGFSVHDTIVIFDRIRENLIKGTAEDFEQVVNRSVVEMLPRDISTSFLVWIILLVLFLFGGSTIKYFVLAMVIGILSGTYSSILNASPLLVTWQGFKNRHKKI